MHKYHFDVHIDEKRINNAGSKATKDCRTILINNGFRDLTISLTKKWYLLPSNLVKLFSTLAYYAVVIQPNSFIVVQYPLLAISPFFKYYIRLLKLKGCRLCCIIHDLDSLRSENRKKEVKKEMDKLSVYDGAISHNNSMTKWLQANGFTGKIEEVFLFDYLVGSSSRNQNCDKEDSDLEVAFAGNLGRGNFLSMLAESDNSFYLNLYGSGFKKSISEKNEKIRWYGSFSPDAIINELKGDFGLIWDGDSTEEITGLMGNYMQYNTPHKTSLYLAAGIPVIVPKNAAIASFIEANNVGVCINSLSEISGKGFKMNRQKYNKMKENAMLIGLQLRQGNYLISALNKIERLLN